MKVVLEMFSKRSCVNTVPMKSAPTNERTGMLSRPNLMFHGIRYGRWSAGSMKRSRITERCAEQNAKVRSEERRVGKESTARVWMEQRRTEHTAKSKSLR